MPTKLENIEKGMELFNAVFPSIAGLIITLKNGKEINVTQLLADTDQFAKKKIDEANEFLDRPGSSDG